MFVLICLVHQAGGDNIIKTTQTKSAVLPITGIWKLSFLWLSRFSDTYSAGRLRMAIFSWLCMVLPLACLLDIHAVSFFQLPLIECCLKITEYRYKAKFKAALINILILLIDKFNMCNMIGVVCGGKHTENYHQVYSCPQLYGVFYQLSANCFDFEAHSCAVSV